jgi:two-component system sensor histidine kinase RegB
VRLCARVAGEAVHIEVIDRGSGMAEAILARVSEPFFTTKEPGRGMGLGLFLTRTVVEGLGGRLSLSSQPGVGTRALVVLPLVPSG